MRIAVLTAHQNKIGGAETYIGGILNTLAALGHDLALCSEYAASPNADSILPPRGCEISSVADRGATECLKSLKSWAPDLLYVHDLENWQWEESMLDLSPAVYYAHNYHGTCISGSKTHLCPIA